MEINESLIPIVFGVTGHRDLREQDISALENEIKRTFQNIKEHYKSTPLMLLSPLAEGADRIAVKAALNVGGIEIIVPLPMPKEEYKKDFRSLESKEEFEELLKNADTYFELPLLEGNTIENISNYGMNRDKQYEQVGVYIARHSQILIALWDGVKKSAVGGTSQIVNFKLNGEPESYIKQKPSPLEPFERWPVYHILTPRKSNPNPEGEKLKLKMIYPQVYKELNEQEVFEKSLISQLESILRSTDNFNKDILERLPVCIKQSEEKKKNETRLNKLSDKIGNSSIINYIVKRLKKCYGTYELFDQDEKSSFSDEINRLYGLYNNADILSIYYGRKRRTTLIITSILSFFAAVAFIVYKRNSSIVLLCLYPLITFIALAYYRISIDKKNYQNKHQDYRALAEGLRVQLFWRMTGLADDVSDHYLIKHKSELDWTRNAIRMWNIPRGIVTKQHGDNEEEIQIVKVKWIQEQYSYFDSTVKKYNRKLSKLGKVAGRVARYSFPVAFIILIMHILPLDNIKDIRSIIVFSTALVPLSAATYINYYNKMSYKELTKQYKRMAGLFKRAGDALSLELSSKNYKGIKGIMLELGIEALSENGDWLILNRQKPIDVPIK